METARKILTLCLTIRDGGVEDGESIEEAAMRGIRENGEASGEFSRRK
jgi:ADP-ribose pyrophosphatase YjhB (NUDIX family)